MSLKLRLPLGLALGTLALVAPRPAQAQTTGLIPLRVKVGAALPSSGTTRENAGSVVPAAEVDVRIPRFLGGSYFTAGIQSRSHNGGHLNVIPLTISRTFQPGNPVDALTGSPYFGIGAGAYLLNGKKAGNDSDSNVTVGGFGQAGYQFPNKFFVEAKYQLVAGRANGLSANGLLLFVGRSF